MHVEEPSLVGREPELAALAGLIGEARAGRGRVAILLRDAGIGKTRLAEAAETMARQSGFVAAWGRCSSADMPAYWPWRQVLTNLLGETDLLDQGRFASQPELFAAVAEAIEVRTRAHAVLVIFEDAHWADPDSLALLEFLAGVVSGQRLMLLITARDEAVSLPTSAGIRRLALAGLDRHATAALVEHIVGVTTSQDYIAEVHRRTGGNPFFASEVARLQVSRGTPKGAIPPGVQQVLEHRLARLRQESFALLQVASVVGSPHPGILVGVTGTPEADVEALLEDPAAAGVVVAGAFAHDLTREALYLGMSPSRRADLHRQVAEHLQGAGPAELARHWSLASGEDARMHAAELAIVAGDMAVAGLAHEQAIGHYRMALELGAGGLDVQRRMGEAQLQAGHIGAGRDVLRLVARKAKEAKAGEVLARAVLAMGGGVGGFEVDVLDLEQERLLKDALRLLPDQDSALRAAILARLSIASAVIASPDERASLADQAANMARRVGDTEAEVAALAAFCDARSGPAYVPERIEAAGRMLALSHHHALLELLGRRIRLRARLELGDLTGVDADIAAYARVADRLRSPTYSWLVPLWRGMRAVLDGDLDAGSRYSEEVATLAGKAQSANADPKLVDERSGNFWKGRRYENGIKWRSRRRAFFVAIDDVDVRDVLCGKALPSLLGQAGPSFNARHEARQSCKQRGLVAVAGANLEDMLVSNEPERLDHHGRQRRLGGHLAMWDRYRGIVICQLHLVQRHEGRSRHRAHRVEHPRVVHAGPPSRRDQLL